jgi:Leucine-rich repeat (LRR) protein
VDHGDPESCAWAATTTDENGNVVGLSARARELDGVPCGLSDLRHLTRLDLSHNRLTSLPAVVVGLT